MALSNSKSQGEYILSQAKKASLTNLEVVTANIEDFQTDKKFDRILSIEMFEHMRNWELLFNKLYPLLKTNGKVFLHFFSNSLAAYPFEDRGPSDWMARTFFTGGLMPSEDIFNYLNTPFKLVEQWRIDGRHYALTLNAWLYRMDQNKQEILDLFKNVYGDQATIWFNRWRMFLMGCDSYFNFRNGETSGVTHLLLKRDVDS